LYEYLVWLYGWLHGGSVTLGITAFTLFYMCKYSPLHCAFWKSMKVKTSLLYIVIAMTRETGYCNKEDSDWRYDKELLEPQSCAMPNMLAVNCNEHVFRESTHCEDRVEPASIEWQT